MGKQRRRDYMRMRRHQERSEISVLESKVSGEECLIYSRTLNSLIHLTYFFIHLTYSLTCSLGLGFRA